MTSLALSKRPTVIYKAQHTVWAHALLLMPNIDLLINSFYVILFSWPGTLSWHWAGVPQCFRFYPNFLVSYVVRIHKKLCIFCSRSLHFSLNCYCFLLFIFLDLWCRPKAHMFVCRISAHPYVHKDSLTNTNRIISDCTTPARKNITGVETHQDNANTQESRNKHTCEITLVYYSNTTRPRCQPVFCCGLCLFYYSSCLFSLCLWCDVVLFG